MRNNIKLISFIAFAILAVSCKEVPELPTVVPNVVVENVPDNQMNFDSDALDTIRFSITSDAKWNIGVKDAAWLTVEPREGLTGRTTVTVYADENAEVLGRNGILTILSKDFNKKISVNQDAAAPYFTIVGDEQGSIVVESIPDSVSLLYLSGNVTWEMSATNLDWCAIVASEEGVCPSVISILPEQNLGAQRSGTLSFIPSNGLPKVDLSIIQKKVKPFILLDVDSLAFTSEGEAKTSNKVFVSSNVEWDVESSADWLHYSIVSVEGGKEVSLTLDENTMRNDRSATLTFTAPETESQVLSVGQDKSMFYADLSTPVIWKSDDWEYMEKHNPDWSKKGANSYSFGTGKGIALPEGDAAETAYLKWEKVATGASADYTATPLTTKEGHFTVKYMFTDDAYVFYVPVTGIAAGKKLCLDFTLKGNQYCVPYYIVEFCLDGTTWVVADTGETYTTGGLSLPATIKIAKDTNKSVTAKYTVGKAVARGLIKARIRIPDGTINIAGSKITTGAAAASKSSTLRLFKNNYDGPAIYVE